MRKKLYYQVLALSLAGFMASSIAATQFLSSADAKDLVSSSKKEESTINLKDLELDTRSITQGLLDDSVAYKLPDAVKDNDEISVIVKMETESLLDAYNDEGSNGTVAQFVGTRKAQSTVSTIAKRQESLLKQLKKAKIPYTLGRTYSVLFGGFEINVKAKDFQAVNEALGNSVTTIVGEVYEAAQATSSQQIVTNDVKVYDTGIFDSSDSKYDGSGTVVAVLDTGYDYTHTAYSAEAPYFTSENLAFDEDYVDDLIKNGRQVSVYGKTEHMPLSAAETTAGLTVADVYMNDKIPFAYDYADKDTDVYPIRSEHGTHVAGIIAGKDDTITGVAPNAQLALMKVFSDTKDGAKTSWLLDALEDCVVLGVDVINMSLGSSCGFSRDDDKTETAKLYDIIKEQGISLVVAASNDYNSTFGSTKNGNLGLTSNPDSATVGSPSTYDASLSVASIKGVYTPYLTYGDRIIYFNEATDGSGEQKKFVDELLPEGVNEKVYDYVTVPGIGLSADYGKLDVTGKIALIKRGTNTFEEKAQIAARKGAAGVIIYNNVSGDIGMTVGNVKAAVCSISQVDGEALAANPTGQIKLSREQLAGPFMSDFSSWGPTPNLGIKPEITAHGGDILSAVPGQKYDRLSGTSMAAPNQAGVTALVRQYVKETFPELSPVEVTARVNQLMMSTTDIAYNTNGLPFAVRKQGAGLANLTKTTSTTAYLTTFGKDGAVMDKTKLELGDDAEKAGVYTMTFAINNFGTTNLSFLADAIVMTEGVSEVKTHQGDTTVTEKGYTLDGASVSVVSVTGEGASNSGSTITVAAGKVATVTMRVTLSDEDKAYLDASFENGMYVEGFVTLKATNGGVDLNVPYLSFYGDWTQAPIFDLDYFETNKDELDDAIDPLDKTMADAYPTTPIGSLYDDYINYLGGFYFIQNPTTTQIHAQREHISLSNQTEAVNGIYGVYAGLLRGAKKVVTTITDEVTGEVIFEKINYDARKSHNGGGAIYPSAIDLDFHIADYNLKNNTRYTVKLQAYLDYGDGGLETNVRNVFEFPFVTDFQAPVLENCEFYTEYDKASNSNRLYAKLSVYDNHYAMALNTGNLYVDTVDGTPTLQFNSFSNYPTQVYSSFNSTTTVTVELTDHLDKCLSSFDHKEGNTGSSFVVFCYDYAMNQAMYEIEIPDDVRALYFKEESITISPNETYKLAPEVFPAGQWAETVVYSTTDTNGEVIRIVDGNVIGVAAGTATVTATSKAYPDAKATVEVTVLGPSDPGYRRYDKPVIVNSSFTVDSYTTLKAYYALSSQDRDIGEAGHTRQLSAAKTLSMFPSESVQLNYDYKPYFEDSVTVKFVSGNENIVKIDDNGIVTAVGEGVSSVSVQLLMDGKPTYFTQNITVSVKNPYDSRSGYLYSYKGNGGVVEIPEYLTVRHIMQYAFSNYEYVLKGPEDEISEEDPSKTKPMYIGDDTIEEVIIPEGVEDIGAYAFAGLTALKSVTLPSTLAKISEGAFEGCTSLETVNGLKYVQFVNQTAFKDCKLEEVEFDNMVAIGNYAFANNKLEEVELPTTAQSLGIGAFENNPRLKEVTINATEVKIGQGVFRNCSNLKAISINAAVIPNESFKGCSSLTTVTLGSSVSVIGTNAFAGTKVQKFSVKTGNKAFKAGDNQQYIYTKDGATLVLAAPVLPENITVTATKIGKNAFSGNATVKTVSMPNATLLEDYAFYQATKLQSVTASNLTKIGNSAFNGCTSLMTANVGTLTQVGNYAFANTYLNTLPAFDENLNAIGNYAFAGTKITGVTLPNNIYVGAGAFAECNNLSTVTIGENATIGDGAFQTSYDDKFNFQGQLASVTIGDGATIGNEAFANATKLQTVTLEGSATIGDRAFFNCSGLKNIDLSSVTEIGDEAFSGLVLYRSNGSGQIVELIYMSAAMTSVDLSSTTKLGAGAFAGAQNLESVTAIHEDLTEIPANAFITTALTSFDFSGITSIGDGAFANTKFTSVNLGKVTSIGDGAFQSAESLTTVNKLSQVKNIGAYAFANTALTSVRLTNAESVGDLAFAETQLKSVNFGDNLTDIGENPFAGTQIPLFESKKDVEFNDEVYKETTYTYDVNDSLKVIDGALYKKTANGNLELITYPLGDTATQFTVADGTVRIGAYAFSGSTLVKVELPKSLRAIGHKAFFGCEKLSVVVFHSIEAPLLEEEYDTNYQLITNVPHKNTGYINTTTNEPIEGLDIVPYYIWDVAYSLEAFFYGANFTNYIGHFDSSITLVRPKNGKLYDSFIYDQYFQTTVLAKAEAEDATLVAIEAISKLPTIITLEDEALVKAARNAFSKVTDYDQMQIVRENNLEKLTNAEKEIEYLKSKQEQPEEPPQDDKDEPVVNEKDYTLVIVLCSIGGSLIIAAGVVVGFLLLKGNFFKKKTAPVQEEEATEEFEDQE